MVIHRGSGGRLMPTLDTDDLKRILSDYARKAMDGCEACQEGDGVCLQHNDEFWNRARFGEAVYKISLDDTVVVWLPGDDTSLPDHQLVWGFCPDIGLVPWASVAEDVRKTNLVFPEYEYKMARRTVQSPPKPPKKKKKNV